MAVQNINDEFEVSFNYKNVLYLCQVKLIKEAQGNDSYFSVEFYSPNEKGCIAKLIPKPGKDGSESTVWSEPGNEHGQEFVQEVGHAIAKKEM